MDTVYGTKKYFQSLSGASDIYRSQGCRAAVNDYTYQNTLGRRSTLGAYYHMNKQPAYTNEHSINSQYGYNAWGIWRDGRNIAPSTFSTKTHAHYQKTRSFSIILTTAAFIVLLAVVSIAGLAFYFSSIKANMEDPVLGFEGSFRIAKGDLFSTGLKYNHTTTYKQKIEFYRRFVDRALTDNGLQPLRTDIWGFGEGPLIKVFFRTFFDVRKLPQNIHSVEEYIKESLFLETTSAKSLYRSLRIDADSVETKRILDEQVVKSASLFKEAAIPTSQTQLEKRLLKKGGTASPTLLSKPSAVLKPRTTTRPHSLDDEPDVDVENAPVIQGSFEGSFEITKTDADIAHKKATPTKAYTSLPAKAVTPFSLRVKPKKPSIEKLTTIIPHQQPKEISTTRATTSKPTTTTTSTTTTTTTTTTARPSTSRAPTTTTTSTTTTSTTAAPARTTTPTTTTTTTALYTERPSSSTNRLYSNQFTFPEVTSPPPTLSLPKLDANLFTSSPILDTAPWKPIHREVPELLPGPPPAFPTKTLHPVNVPVAPVQPAYVQDVPQRRIDEMELPFIPDNASPPAPPSYDPYPPGFFGPPMRKPVPGSQGSSNSPDLVMFHGFNNPVFMPGADDIERLGAGAQVQPHPLPVQLIDEVRIPPFKPITPTLGSIDKLSFSIEKGDEKFEHLGGGVIVKKHENPFSGSEAKIQEASSTTERVPTSTAATAYKIVEPTSVAEIADESTKYATGTTDEIPSANAELAETIGELFRDLFDLPKDIVNTSTTTEKLESRIEPDEESPISDVQDRATTATSTAGTGTDASTGLGSDSEAPTKKPTFLNLKEIILRRNSANSNQTRQFESSSSRPSTSTTTPTTQTSTTAPPMATTTKRRRVHPSNKKPPTVIDPSNLFPSHSKWEFVNSSSTNSFEHTGNMRKVYNETLQAWLSEDVEKSENLTLNDIKTRINNATNIQDISLIFDTLASKLGITPSVPAKVPPFSQNKLKQQLKNETKVKPIGAFTSGTTPTMPTVMTTDSPTTTTTTTPFVVTTPSTTTTTTTPTTTMSTTKTTEPQFIELPLQHREPFIKPMSSFMEDSSSEGIGAAIPVVGEAEVEVIDPTKYEEMLRSSQFADATTETAPKLVTLLPVRSNSGIRTHRPMMHEQRRSNNAGDSSERGGSSSTTEETVSNEESGSNDSIEQGRRFPPAEAIVKSVIKVTA